MEGQPLEEKDPQKSIEEGAIRFRLPGKKLKGGFALIKTDYQKTEMPGYLSRKMIPLLERDMK